LPVTSQGLLGPISQQLEIQTVTCRDSVTDATGAGAVLMGGSYRQCTQCGKRALSIATRCPGCGRELDAPEVPSHGGIRDWKHFLKPTMGVAGALAVAAVAALVGIGRSSPPARERLEVESSMATPVTLDSATVAATTPAESPSELKVARSWTNVRKARSVKAPLEAVLMPGDTVLADSLGKGWYRVALEGEVLGFAHQSTLTSVDQQAQ
jgi:hypothetical protein